MQSAVVECQTNSIILQPADSVLLLVKLANLLYNVLYSVYDCILKILVTALLENIDIFIAVF